VWAVGQTFFWKTELLLQARRDPKSRLANHREFGTCEMASPEYMSRARDTPDRESLLPSPHRPFSRGMTRTLVVGVD
jgi:hypothetical protein